jgi:hypothetical protein
MFSSRTLTDRPWGTLPDNRVLTVFRTYVETSDLSASEYAREWLDRKVMFQDIFLDTVTIEEINFATRVMRHLAGVTR